MSYLGEKQRSEAVRLYLTLDTAPTGTPTATITRQGTSVLTATNMTQGASTLEWYYDYTTGVSATVGAHQVKYTAVVDGVTRFGYDQYDQTIDDFDSLAVDIASVQADTTSIETKVDTIDTVVDAILVDTTAIEIDTTSIETKVDSVQVDTTSIETKVDSIQTDTTSIESKVDTIDTNVDTALTNQTSIEGKIDTIDTVVDSIQVDTTSIETKVDTIDGVVDAILVDTTAIEIDTTSIETKVDTAIVDIAAVPTVGEIDTELTSEHGAGAWTTTGAGSGAYNATVNVKDDSAIDVPNAFVTIHNASDDDAPVIANGTTDNSGNVILAIDGNVYIRVRKAGFNFTSTAKNITATGTYNVTGTAIAATNPSDPDVCRLRLYPITLGNADITDLADEIIISSQGSLTKINDQYIKNTELSFTYDSGTTPDSYYFDAVRLSTCHITCAALGLDHDITVPDEATKNISDLQT
jgi:hypothetical protein